MDNLFTKPIVLLDTPRFSSLPITSPNMRSSEFVQYGGKLFQLIGIKDIYQGVYHHGFKDKELDKATYSIGKGLFKLAIATTLVAAGYLTVVKAIEVLPSVSSTIFDGVNRAREWAIEGINKVSDQVSGSLNNDIKKEENFQGAQEIKEIETYNEFSQPANNIKNDEYDNFIQKIEVFDTPKIDAIKIVKTCITPENNLSTRRFEFQNGYFQLEEQVVKEGSRSGITTQVGASSYSRITGGWKIHIANGKDFIISSLLNTCETPLKLEFDKVF